MQIVDSHCHLDQLVLARYEGSLAKALEYASAQDVIHMLCVCITLADFPKMMEIVRAYPNVSASVGLHPNELTAEEPSVKDLIKLASLDKIVALGEQDWTIIVPAEMLAGSKSVFAGIFMRQRS